MVYMTARGVGAPMIRGRAWGVFALCLGAWTLTNLDQSLFSYALPGILTDFRLPLEAAGIVFAVSFACSSALVIVAGLLADRHGRALTLCLLLAALPLIDPRLRRDPAASTARYRRILRWCRLAVTAFFAVLAVTILAVAVGWPVDVGRIACDGALVMLAVVGNFMGGLQPNYLMGLRTPWTLEDAATWRATHRVGGRVLVFGSAVLLVPGWFVPDAVLLGLLLAFVVGVGFGSLGYSAWFFPRMRRPEVMG